MGAWRGFGSDNHSGVHPEVLSAIAEANVGHAHAYGDDPWTVRATAALQMEFGEHSQVAFVFNGTGANVVGLSAVCRPWESVICAESAHIATDECAAPEHIANVKLVTVLTPDGKLDTGNRAAIAHGFRVRAPCAAQGHQRLERHRTRHRLHSGRAARAGRPRALEGHAAPRRRRAHRQRRGRAQRLDRGSHRPCGSRRPLARRDEERHAWRRGGRASRRCVHG